MIVLTRQRKKEYTDKIKAIKLIFKCGLLINEKIIFLVEVSEGG